MYVESSHGQPGDTTYLSFPQFTSNNPSSLHFSYHMLGDNIGTLDILSKNTATSTVTKLWTRTEEQSRYWIKGCVPLSPETEQTILFVATKASGFHGDIALDNVYVADGNCPGNKKAIRKLINQTQVRNLVSSCSDTSHRLYTWAQANQPRFIKFPSSL